MNLIKCINSLNFDNHLLFNQQIDSITMVKLYFLINNWHWLFFLNIQTNLS
jgi:hypothetical protein